jgi:DNA ligase D-like protein (predicted 3'-phosphoesterase)
VISINTLFENINKNNRFVIHEHHAQRAGLHYDLRLEKDNVLKSWATRKLPDLVNLKTKKIQLFPTPDHDITWIDFKGDILDGYGKGKVLIWDSGSYEIRKWTNKSIVLYFNGKKIKGLFIIVKTKNNSWLMFKKRK